MILRSSGGSSRLVALVGATVLLLAVPQPAAAQEFAVDNSLAAGVPAGESDTGRWLVSLEAPALATYAGGTPGLAATSPTETGADQLDVTLPASVSYRDYLGGVQDRLIDSMVELLDRQLNVTHRFLNVLNGFAVEVSAAEAGRIAELPGVEEVAPDDRRAVTAASFPGIWEAEPATAQIVAGVDRAVAYGAAKLRYVAAGVDDPVLDLVDRALRDAAEAGVVVVVASEPAGSGAEGGSEDTLGDETAPKVTVDRAELAATQAVDQVTERTLTIDNLGTGELEWAFAADRRAPLPSAGSLLRDGEVTITHSASQKVAELNSVACTPGGGVTTENAYLRRFSLDQFGITSGFEVTEVSFGVERINGPPHPVTVNLYTMIDPSGRFEYANFEAIGTAKVELSERALTTVSVPVTGTAPAGSTLVVEVETPNQTAVEGGLFIGSDSAGQTGASYLRSQACGLPEPTNTAGAKVGRPDMHVVMNVTGVGERAAPRCGSPADLPWLSVSATGGTVPAGEQTELAVSFDATGLAPGEYHTVLCVDSNDPRFPRVEVPVTLVVVEQLAGCDETVVGVHEGPLTVTEGVTCLAAGAQVLGEVTVHAGAGLLAAGARIQGPLLAVDAAVVDVAFSRLTGPVRVQGGTELVSLFVNRVTGPVSVVNNRTGETPVTVSGNTIVGSLSCAGNQPGLTNHDLVNSTTTSKNGECVDL